MKKKQTVKQLLMGLVVLAAGAMGSFVSHPVYAAECGGVQTAIISCAQKGQCADGSNPYEGTKPSSGDQTKKYVSKYNHNYGTCLNGATPSKDASSTGLWGVLLLAINILTAGIGITAIGGVVYGSILYTSAGGSQEQVKKAMGIITNVVIGVIAYALMYSALNFLIPGGLFN